MLAQGTLVVNKLEK